MHVLRRLSATVPLVFGAAILVVADRFLKALVSIGQHLSIRVIPDLLHIEYSLNTHAAFSIPLPSAVYVVLFIVALGILSALWVTQNGAQIPLLRIAGMLLCIGMLSNIWDRIVHGGVIDMLLVPGLGACNLADIYVVSGALLWGIFLLRR